MIIIGHDDNNTVYGFKRVAIADYHAGLIRTLTCPNPTCFIFEHRPLKVTYQVDPILDMSQWNPWGSCAPCLNGNRQRYRPCLAEYPQFGLTCITGQTPETITCVCDCLTPTNNGSSTDSTLTIPSGHTTFGADAHYICNNGKKWSNGRSTLVFRCSEKEIWQTMSNVDQYAYNQGCINCGSPPTLEEAMYETIDAVTTIDSEAVVIYSSGKRFPDGSTTVTMKCTWDTSADSYKWVASTGSMNITINSNFSWQIQMKGEGRM